MRLILSALALLAMLGFGQAQGFAVGDSVTLVERDRHIPAHAAPGNSAVTFRFVTGSIGTVLAIDSASGWIEVQGDRLDGATGSGWITPRYIAGPAVADGGNGDDDGVPEPAWCPPKGSAEAPADGRLRLATWNIGNLNAVDGQSTYTGTDPSEKRYGIDYLRIRCYIRMIDPDILAVQEIDGEEALARVVDADVYDIIVDARPKPGGMGGKQNTGFAYRKGLTVTEQPDFEDLDVSSGGLRYGARIDVAFGAQTLQLMSVHLKSGCFENSMSNASCTQLFKQVPILEGWIDDAASGPDPFVILGDFNRRVDQPGDVVWAEIDDSDPANADLASITDGMPVTCRDNEFTEFIDHILFDKRSIEFVDPSSFRQVTFRADDRPNWDLISDHCPLVVEMRP